MGSWVPRDRQLRPPPPSMHRCVPAPGSPGQAGHTLALLSPTALAAGGAVLGSQPCTLRLHGTSCSSGRLTSAQADQHAHAKAKAELKTFLLSNEENKRIKEQTKERDRADDMRYNAQHAEILAKEEKVRWKPLAGPSWGSPKALHPPRRSWHRCLAGKRPSACRWRLLARMSGLWGPPAGGERCCAVALAQQRTPVGARQGSDTRGMARRSGRRSWPRCGRCRRGRRRRPRRGRSPNAGSTPP